MCLSPKQLDHLFGGWCNWCHNVFVCVIDCVEALLGQHTTRSLDWSVMKWIQRERERMVSLCILILFMLADVECLFWAKIYRVEEIEWTVAFKMPTQEGIPAGIYAVSCSKLQCMRAYYSYIHIWLGSGAPTMNISNKNCLELICATNNFAGPLCAWSP